MTFYLLDTKTISDLIVNESHVVRRAAEWLAAGDDLGLCRPVHYEILRGLLWRGATRKLGTYVRRVIPIMVWTDLEDADWEEAARLWADTRQRGKQLGDPDLLLAAVAHRTGAILVSSDTDFDARLIWSEDWRM